MKITKAQLKRLIKETFYVNPQGTAVDSRTARDDYKKRINSYKGRFKEKIPAIIPDKIDASNIDHHRSMSTALASTLDGSDEEKISFDADTDLALTAIESEINYPKGKSKDPVAYELQPIWDNQMRYELRKEIISIISAIKNKSVKDFKKHIKKASDDEVFNTQISGLPAKYPNVHLATYNFVYKPVIQRLLNKRSLNKIMAVGKAVLGRQVETWLLPIIKGLKWNQSYRDFSWIEDNMYDALYREKQKRERNNLNESIRDVDAVEDYRQKMIKFYEEEKRLNLGINEEQALYAQREIERYYSMSIEDLIQDMDSQDSIDTLVGSIQGTGQQILNSKDTIYQEALKEISLFIGIETFNSIVGREYGINQQSLSLDVNGQKINLPGDITGGYSLPLARIIDILEYEGALEEVLSNIPLDCLIASLSVYFTELKYSSLSSEDSYEYEDSIRESAAKSSVDEIRAAYQFALGEGSDDFAEAIKMYLPARGPGLRLI